MSLRDFKRTLQTCSARTGATTSTTLIRSSKLAPPPKKSSLREQLASIERLAAGLDCTPLGDSLPPPLSTLFSQKSLHKELLQETQRKEPAYASSSSSSYRHASDVSAPKRRRLSDYADRVIHGGSGDLNEVQLSQACSGLATTKEDLPLLKCLNLKEAEEQGEEEEEKEEEERSLPISPGDSEAGLFIQSQKEGLHEPLVLWPSDGQGCLEVTEMVQVPSSINSRLLEHQRTGVQFLYSLYRENKGGVLGDDMGLGKTIQVIAFLSAILPHNIYSFKVDDSDRSQKLKKLVMIICPTSVLRNWQQEFDAWGSFDVAIYHGTSREAVLRRLESQSLQIVLTSFDTFRIHGECLCMVDWNCVFVDEAHRLKNDRSDLYKACVKICTKRRYGLTGTIMQNKIIDLYNVFDWVAPGCLGTREHFREFYEDPLKQGQRISAPDKFIRVAEERKLHLAKVLQKFLLRREKQETIGHLMMGKEDNVIFCEMSRLQHRAYKRLLASPDFQCLIKKDEPCSCGSPLTRAECCYRIVPNGIIWPYLHRESADGCDSCPNCLVLPCLMKLQQVSNHLELIKPNVKDELEKQKKDELLAGFILAEDALLVGGLTQDESFLGLSDAQHCGKMRALEQLLAYWVRQGDKVLLFSYSVRMLDILDKFLIRKGYCFSRLDGSTPMAIRQSMVDDFNRSPSKQVFLISTRAGGLGLNLVSANRVVIFDPNWNPAQDLQAQDRSFRYGQRRHVTVYRLLAAGSLEELVYSRQIYKQQLFNIAVSGNLEKRYFEGVQDSKENKGELFGISNLFRDLSEKAFTSDIIETYDKRVLTILGNNSRESSRMAGKDIGQNLGGSHVARAAKGECTVSVGEGIVSVGDGVISASNSCKQNCMMKRSSEDELSRVLKDAGVIYAHRYEDVVNCKPSVIKGEGGGGQAGQSIHKSATDHALCPLQPNKTKQTPASVSKGLSKELKKDQLNFKKHGKSLKGEVKRWSKSAAVASKEEQFAHLAIFKGMTKTSFCKWLLSASEVEKQKLLLDVKQAKAP